jgi:hypothetical protein
MALGRKTGGRQKGARNRATAEARAAAEATGIMPLDYMLEVMRDTTVDLKRRDAMAMAAAPYLHSRLNAIDGGPNERKTSEVPDAKDVGIQVTFVRPSRREHDELVTENS